VHAWNGRGNTLLALGRHREALADYVHAQQLRPDLPDPHFNEALVRLTLGEFESGWRKHEWRWSLPFWRPRLRGFTQPTWLGESDPRDRVLLLHAEQGFGDTLQFCRYVPLVAATGARVVLEVQPALRALLAQLPGVDTLVARGDTLPAFDLHCPLLSLPLAMGTRVFTIPPPLPRLQADPERTAAWDARWARAAGCGSAWPGKATPDTTTTATGRSRWNGSPRCSRHWHAHRRPPSNSSACIRRCRRAIARCCRHCPHCATSATA